MYESVLFLIVMIINVSIRFVYYTFFQTFKIGTIFVRSIDLFINYDQKGGDKP